MSFFENVNQKGNSELKDHTNPHYGQGAYHRQIRIIYSQGKVIAGLEDDLHAFSLELDHDNQKITQIKSQAIRYPFTTCPSADKPLQTFVGLDINLSASEYNALNSARANCTHLYDLVLCALFHFEQDKPKPYEVFYEICVKDEIEQGSNAQIKVNGEKILQWQARGFELISPKPIAGNPLMSGFSRWAIRTFEDLELQAAFMLQKGFFVAQARRYTMHHLVGKTAASDTNMGNTCHTYSPDISSHAIRMDNPVKDFFDDTTQLLKFLPKS